VVLNLFLVCGTLKIRNKFGDTLASTNLRNRASCYTFQLKYSHFLKRIVKFKDLKRLAAHLEEAHGTLVRRGTQVEKHCSTHTFYKYWIFT
jgi:hypothetical protein